MNAKSRRQRTFPLTGLLVGLCPAGSSWAQDAPPFTQLLQQAGPAPRVAVLNADEARAKGFAEQGRARPNPTVNVYAENFAGGLSRNAREQEQITGQLDIPIELSGKRSSRIAAGEAGIIAARARGVDGRLLYPYDHLYLGAGHERNERRTWFVIVLCAIMMLIEIVGGILFGSIALVADGLHMSTHAGALLLAALAYTFSRRYSKDPRFSFGTGKLGDLAGFTSAIVLAMIALLIGYESVTRLISPVPIHFGEAIPIAVLGLCVNVASAWLLSGGHDHGHGHSHGHGHHHGHGDHDHDDAERVALGGQSMLLSVFEDGVPLRFQLAREDGAAILGAVTIETLRPDGARQLFDIVSRAGFLESRDEIPEPHAFAARVSMAGQVAEVAFEEHDHGHGDAHSHEAHDRDNNMRAAIVHVVADAAVSVLVIVGLILARTFGWLWMGPIAGIVGAFVIASWSYGLIRDTGAILLDMLPSARTAERMRREIEEAGDKVVDLHLWRLGPGHLGAIVAVVTGTDRTPDFCRARLARIPSVSHLTVEVNRAAA